MTVIKQVGTVDSIGADAIASESPKQALIEVAGLSVSFLPPGGERRTVVEDVGFRIERGSVLALVGESGSGKSVTGRSLVGLAGAGSLVSARTLRVAGHDVLGLDEKAWRRIRGSEIGFVLQDALTSLDNLRRVGAEVAEPLRLHTRLGRRTRDARVLDLLAEAGVPDPASRVRQYPYELSGGLRQRALIASAIANRPSVLIADEPTTALDATVAAQILRLLGGLVGDDGALLMISHDLAAVAAIADRIAVMNAGRIVEEGAADQILGDPQHPYTKRLLAAVPRPSARGRRLSADPRRAFTRSRAAGTANRAVPTPVIEVEGIAKRFRGEQGSHRTVLHNVSFAVHQGETLGIVGESGSGKTTAARIALGVERADAGRALVLGVEWHTMNRAQRSDIRRRVQLVSQDPQSSFDPRYTVGRVLAEPLRVAGMRGRASRTRAEDLLDLVRLPAATLDRRPLELSGGQRQRVAIARALAVEPDMIVADEPVSALDVSVQAQILDLFADVQSEFGVACLFISHDLAVIHHVADRVVVLAGGRVVEQGEVETVFARPAKPYTRELLDAIPRLDDTQRRRTPTLARYTDPEPHERNRPHAEQHSAE